MKIAAIIQARMGSTRLPGKVMKHLNGKTVLSHVIERVKQSQLIDDIIIATTFHKQDDCIKDEAIRCDAKVYRGSEDDVLSRYYQAAVEHQLDTIVRITSDCPVIDPHVVDNMIRVFRDGEMDLVTNAGSDVELRTFPRGLDTEIFTFRALEEAYNQGNQTYHREHVTPYIYETSTRIHYVKNETDYSMYRWTLDTIEDFALISEIYNMLYKGSHDFYLQDVVTILEGNPALSTINAHVEQKNVK